MGSGLILDDEGKKMSKSSANGVSPLQVIEKYGSDAARLHVHFLGGYEDNTPWTFDGINGITNFLNRVWEMQDMIKGEEVSEKHIYEINSLIKKVTEDIDNLKLNTAIASLMSFVKLVKTDGFITRDEYKIFLTLLNPLAPHITSEIYEIVFGGNIVDAVWPQYDEKYLEKDEIKLPIQINGKMKGIILVSRNISQDELIEKIKTQNPTLIVGEIRKVIFVPGKIINIICG